MSWPTLMKLQQTIEALLQPIQVLAHLVPELVALGVVIMFLFCLNVIFALGVRKLKRHDEEKKEEW